MGAGAAVHGWRQRDVIRQDDMAMDVETAVEYLEGSRERGRLGHAYLVSGGDVAQRASLGLMVLRELAGISAGSLEQAEGSRAVIVSPGSASRRIVVDQIRKQVEPRLQAASGGQLKVAIIQEADRLVQEASNAFLKTLEEPPPDCLILLLTGFPEQLLETVRSRCIRLPLHDVPIADRIGAEGEALLATLAKQFPKAGHNGNGALGLLGVVNSALRAAKAGFREEGEATLKVERATFNKTTESGEWLKGRESELKALAQARYLARRSDTMAVILRWMGDCLLQASGEGNGVAFASEADTTTRVGHILGEEDLLRRIGCLEELVDNLETTVSEPLAIEVGILDAFT